MANYITAINRLFSERLAALPDFVLFGENVNNGSFISGLTRHLAVRGRGRIMNVGNCEATHCGVGFGLMMNGVSSVLFAKQLDFMLLGIDQIVNTYNFVRACPPPEDTLGSFTIVTIVCDQGMQGPQSSFNGLGDICSLARVPGHCITASSGASALFDRLFQRPGFRLVCLSQRLFAAPAIDIPLLRSEPENGVFQYAEGKDLCVVCFNFALPHGLEVVRLADSKGLSVSLFSLDYTPADRWETVVCEAGFTGRVVVIDDSKGAYRASDTFARRVAERGTAKITVLNRSSEIRFGVDADEMQVDQDGIDAWIRRNAKV